jgi:hypothetical protein
MKTVFAMLLSVGLIPMAGAQNNPVLAKPAADVPAQPSNDKPAQPSADKPAQPSGDTPAQPGTISKLAPTTPGVLQTQEEPTFRPFNTATGQIATPDQPVKISTTTRLTGSNVETEATLRRKQAAEIKALRESMKKRPNSEINKAVKAKLTEQKAAMQKLRAANKL